ncbi:MAG: hypothetical protein QG604_805 [Candidatus Dependentiae bacterium]|nr:hypothetical protein [Candidatus Dependentiae bacterium]
MNERARWRHRRTLYGIIIWLILCGIAMHLYTRVAAWASTHYAVTSHVLVYQQLDDDTVSDIGLWFDEQKKAGNLAHPDYVRLNAELLEVFPLIGATSWSRYNPTCLTCTMIGVSPAFAVNKHYIAGDNRRLYDAPMFITIPENLPQVRVNPLWLSGDRFPEVYTFIAGLPARFLSVFNCAYHDPHMVVISPKEALDLPHRCVCVVDGRSVSLVPDMVVLMSLCQVLQEDNKPSEEKSVCYFDFRFSGRVISKCITHRECVQLQRV